MIWGPHFPLVIRDMVDHEKRVYKNVLTLKYYQNILTGTSNIIWHSLFHIYKKWWTTSRFAYIMLKKNRHTAQCKKINSTTTWSYIFSSACYRTILYTAKFCVLWTCHNVLLYNVLSNVLIWYNMGIGYGLLLK